jgi:signal transduction histidine kinase/ABC-type amino acid transport substrate-binding protein
MTGGHKYPKVLVKKGQVTPRQLLSRHAPPLLIILVALSVIILVQIRAAGVATGNSTDLDSDPLVFLGNHLLPPMNYLENDQAKGLTVEIVQAMAERMERPVTIKLMDWAEAQQLVLDGKADALIQINYTKEREPLFDFSDPLLETEFAIFIPADKPGITNILALRGLTVATEAKGFSMFVLKRDPLINIRPVPDQLSGFNLLLEGSVDAVVGDRWVGTYTLAENNIKGVAIANHPIDINYSSIAVKKGNGILLAEINKALNEIKQDGTYQRIIDKWQAKEVVYQTFEQERQQRLMIAGILAALLLALFFVLVLLYMVRRSKRAEETLIQEEAFRGILLELAADFVNVPLAEFDRAINAMLEKIGEFTNLDRAYLFLHDHLRRITTNTHEWCREGITPEIDNLQETPFDLFRDYLELWEKGEIVHIPSVEKMSKEQPMRSILAEQGIKSLVLIPLLQDQLNTGFVGFDAVNECRSFSEQEINLLRVLAEIISNAFARKEAEAAIAKLNADLEHRIAERTVQLEALNKELESFAYSISHDFRAPLRALDGFSANLQAKYDDHLDDQGRHYLNRIRNAAIYMSNLVDDLLDLSRINRKELKKQQVDLSKQASEVMALLQQTEPQREANFMIAPELQVHGDAALLQSALQNLLENAWKFSSKEAQAEIEVGRTKVEGEAVFFVRDNGVGFNMAYAKNLFGAFQRLHGVNEFPGTGIGLATVQRIINRHGGRIWAESEVGKGATFYFTLQALAPEEPTKANSKS